MAHAWRDRAPAHARIFSGWLELPTWRALSTNARALLVEIIGRYRPGENGRLAWPVRRAAEVLGVSKATAGRALIELERNGWIKVVSVAAFGGRAKPATYMLTMFRDDATGEPASNAFEYLPGESAHVKRSKKVASQSHGRDKPVPVARLNGFTGGTRQSHGADMRGPIEGPGAISEALRNSRIFRGKREGDAE